MKTIILTLSVIAALTLSSCVNPQTTTSIGQNRFGYNGTASANPQPTSGLQQSVVADPVTTNRFLGGATQTTPTSDSGNDTIAIDSLPTGNPQPTNDSTSTATNDPSVNDNVVTNDSTPPTNSNVTPADKPSKPEYLYGIPVPGRDGMVYSPYNKDAGYIDVRNMKPGALAEDPYTPGKLFRVP